MVLLAVTPRRETMKTMMVFDGHRANCGGGYRNWAGGKFILNNKGYLS
ncbi:hypothetical protein KCP78_04685 [Salmonella enterica subsp. enterica]|nr:hypothetical protein KCP78_04685 [Salmonella enterica subsp. enterica]